MPSLSGLDPWTELAVVFKEPVKTGADFEPWVLDEIGLPVFIAAMEARGWTLEELPVVMATVSDGRWAMSADLLERWVDG